MNTSSLSKYSHNCSALVGKYNDTLLLFLPQELVDKILLYVIISSRHPIFDCYGLLTIRKVLPYLSDLLPYVNKDFSFGVRRNGQTKKIKKMRLAHRRLQWELAVQDFEENGDDLVCGLPKNWHNPGVHHLKTIKNLIMRKGDDCAWDSCFKKKYSSVPDVRGTTVRVTTRFGRQYDGTQLWNFPFSINAIKTLTKVEIFDQHLRWHPKIACLTGENWNSTKAKWVKKTKKDLIELVMAM